MEAVEAKSQQLRSRLHMIETSSTCNYRQVHSPATILVSTEQGQGHTDGSEVKEPEVRDAGERLTRSSVKRKAVEDAIQDGSKKLYAARKSIAATRSRDKAAAEVPNTEKPTADQENDKRGESRSQRHKKKLEEVVKDTLRRQNINKDDALFKPCALRLYNVTKSFVKDLTNYQSLRQEMERIAQSNVQMVVGFETDRQARSKVKH